MKDYVNIKKFEIYKNDFYLLPTIRFYLNNLVYASENFSLEFHFLTLHFKLLFIKRDIIA